MTKDEMIDCFKSAPKGSRHQRMLWTARKIARLTGVTEGGAYQMVLRTRQGGGGLCRDAGAADSEMLQVISSSACQLEPLFKGHTGANYSSLPGQVPADRPLVALGARKLIKLPSDNGRRYRPRGGRPFALPLREHY
jgi:hypothetical protein